MLETVSCSAITKYSASFNVLQAVVYVGLTVSRIDAYEHMGVSIEREVKQASKTQILQSVVVDFLMTTL